MQHDNGKKKEKPKNTKQALARIFHYTADFRFLIFLCIIFAICSNIGNLLGPKFAGKAIEEAQGKLILRLYTIM